MTKKYPIVEEYIHDGFFDFDSPQSVCAPTKTSNNKKILGDSVKGVYLYQANCLELMDAIAQKHPQGCFEMIFADPPYFLSNGGISCQNGKMVCVNKGDWDKSNGVKLNHEFNIEWLKRCQKLLKPNGTLWVTGTHHVIHSIGLAMQELGYKLLNDIVWEKPNPPPNLSCRYFTHSTETLLWAAKNQKSKHTFNYEAMRKENGGTQMKTVWKILPPNKIEKSFGKHPTQKPIALIERCILASTNENDFVLDPFAGSSTTGVVAVKNNRRYCGIEIDSNFVELSKQRLEYAIERLPK